MAKYDRWYKVELSLRMDNADIADEDAVIVAGNVPFAGTIKQAWCGAAVLPTTATLALAKGSTNILTDTTVDVVAPTAGTAASQTLAAGKASRPFCCGGRHADGDLDVHSHRPWRWVCGRGVDRAGRVLDSEAGEGRVGLPLPTGRN